MMLEGKPDQVKRRIFASVFLPGTALMDVRVFRSVSSAEFSVHGRRLQQNAKRAGNPGLCRSSILWDSIISSEFSEFIFASILDRRSCLSILCMANLRAQNGAMQ